MATLTAYGSTHSGSTWTNRPNALYSPGTFATLTTTVVATYTLDIAGLNLDDKLPADAVIDQVRVTIPHYVSNTSRWFTPTLSAISSLDGAVVSGTTNNLTLTNSSSNTNTITFTTLTATQLRDNNFGFRYSIAKNQAQSATTNVDFMRVDVDYRTESWQEVKL